MYLLQVRKMVNITKLSAFVPPEGIYPKPHWETDVVHPGDECDRFGLGTFGLPPCTNDNVVPPGFPTFAES